MSRYVLAEGVELDLDSIWEYIAQDSIDAADQWITRLFAAFETIATSPGIGHTRHDLTNAQVLFWPVENYLVIYRNQSKSVEIVAVTQGSRDIPAFLRPRPL